MLVSARSLRTGALFRVDNTVRATGPALRPYVRRTYTTSLPRESIDDFDFRRIPEASVHLYLLAETDAHGSLSRATLRVQGVGDRLTDVVHASSSVTMAGVELEVGAARQILGVPASTLFGEALSLDDVWGSRAGDLLDAMLSARTPHGRGLVLGRALLSRARRGEPPPRSIVGALRAIHRTKGHLRVADIAKKVGVSAPHLQRQFTEEVGCTPKRYARMTRLRRLLFFHHVERGAWSWADCAAEYGYADQAHLISDFRKLMNASPERLLGRGDFVPEFVRYGWLLTPRVSDLHKNAEASLP